MKNVRELKEIVKNLDKWKIGPGMFAIQAAVDALQEMIGDPGWDERYPREVDPYDPNFPAAMAGEGMTAGTHDPSSPTKTDIGKPELGGRDKTDPAMEIWPALQPVAPAWTPPPFAPGPAPSAPTPLFAGVQPNPPISPVHGKVNTTGSLGKPI